MLSYNLSTVTKLRVFKKRVSFRWTWYPAKNSFFGLIKKPAGFEDYYDWDSKREEECPKNHYTEKANNFDDLIVYEDPHVILWFNDGSDRKFYFKTPEEALNAAAEVKYKSGCEWYEHK